ncbi:hypothetical protein AB0J43_16700 [Nonomuraea fuscirosea]
MRAQPQVKATIAAWRELCEHADLLAELALGRGELLPLARLDPALGLQTDTGHADVLGAGGPQRGVETADQAGRPAADASPSHCPRLGHPGDSQPGSQAADVSEARCLDEADFVP